MKDTLLTIPFNYGEIRIWHKSMMGRLQDIFQIGNIYRYKSGKEHMPLTAWIRRNDVQEYIDFLSNEIGEPALTHKKGKYGGAFAHLYIMIDAATSLSPEFKHEVYHAFITQKICITRDIGGEAFKLVNVLLDKLMVDALGDPPDKRHYIAVAKALNDRVAVLTDSEAPINWNCASAEQLQWRAKLEDRISSALSLGFVRDWKHLVDIIHKS